MIKYIVYERQQLSWPKPFYIKSYDIAKPITSNIYFTQYTIFKDFSEDSYSLTNGLDIDMKNYTPASYEVIESLYKKLSQDYENQKEVYGYNLKNEGVLKDIQLVLTRWDDDY